MSKKCIRCGAELDDGAAFCDECGAPQTSPQPQPEKKDEFSKVNSIKKAKSEYNENPEIKKRGMSIASLVMGIISVCTLGIFFVPEILGLVFGIIAICDKKMEHAMAIGGTVMSAIAFILGIILWIVV